MYVYLQSSSIKHRRLTIQNTKESPKLVNSKQNKTACSSAHAPLRSRSSAHAPPLTLLSAQCSRCLDFCLSFPFHILQGRVKLLSAVRFNGIKESWFTENPVTVQVVAVSKRFWYWRWLEKSSHWHITDHSPLGNSKNLRFHRQRYSGPFSSKITFAPTSIAVILKRQCVSWGFPTGVFMHL